MTASSERAGTMSSVRRSVRIALAVAIAASALVLAEGSTAGAVGTVTLSSSEVTDGETVTVTTSGLPADTPETTWVLIICGLACSEITPRYDVLPSVVDVTIRDRWMPTTPVFSAFECSDLPNGCRIVVERRVVRGNSTTISSEASALIRVVPPPWVVQATPSTLRGGDTAQLTLTGFPAGPGTIAICPIDADLTNASETCDALVDYPDGLPATVSARVPSGFDTAYPGLSCLRGCGLGAYVTSPDTAEVIAADIDAIQVTAPPLTVSPALPSTATASVEVSGSGFPPGPVGLVQCQSPPYLNLLPNPPFDVDGCSEPQPAVVADDWTLMGSMTASAEFTTRTGTGASCVPTEQTLACFVAVVTEAGRYVAGAPVAFGGPKVFVTNAGDDEVLENADVVSVTVAAAPGSSVTASSCATPLGPTLAESRCDPESRVDRPVYSPTLHASMPALDVRSTFPTSNDIVDCRVESCVVAAFGADGTFLAASDPLRFREPPAATVTPSTGLTHGQPTRLDAAGLEPGVDYRLLRCVAGSGPTSDRCGSGPTLYEADADGRVATVVFAMQRFTDQRGRYRYCRDQCTLELVRTTTQSIVAAPYRMAAPAVSASPSAGLTDGQTVTVDATGLQPTYAGPTVLFATGGWAVVQCDAAVGTNPSIVTVFQQCAVAPGGASVPVAGSTASAPVTVRGTITKILGGTTDCTSSSGACVAGFTRWEQDGTTSSAFTPLTFG